MPAALDLPKRSIFKCKCGNEFQSSAITRAKCVKCGSLVSTHIPIPSEYADPRRTLTDVQEALSAIAIRAKDQNASEIDVSMARIFADSMKYLVPALEASMVQNTNDSDIVERLLGRANNDHPLPAHSTPALPRGSQPPST